MRWYKTQLLIEYIRPSLEDIRDLTLNLGNWLKDQRYMGKDVKITNPSKEMSTVYSFSLIGWRAS